MCGAAYTGVACGLACPGDLTNPCSGHGLCSATTGDCDRAPRWDRGYGEVCDAGPCDDGGARTGVCLCSADSAR